MGSTAESTLRSHTGSASESVLLNLTVTFCQFQLSLSNKTTIVEVVGEYLMGTLKETVTVSVCENVARML